MIKCVVIEVVVSFGWECYVGMEGKIIIIDYFGVFVFGGLVFEKFGFIFENVVNIYKLL